MTTLDGVFSLRTPRDLREKLESDFARLDRGFAGFKPGNQRHVRDGERQCARHVGAKPAHTAARFEAQSVAEPQHRQGADAVESAGRDIAGV